MQENCRHVQKLNQIKLGALEAFYVIWPRNQLGPLYSPRGTQGTFITTYLLLIHML